MIGIAHETVSTIRFDLNPVKATFGEGVKMKRVGCGQHPRVIRNRWTGGISFNNQVEPLCFVTTGCPRDFGRVLRH